MSGPTVITGWLPAGQPFTLVVTNDCIGARTDDISHLSHSNNLSPAALADVAATAQALLDEHPKD